MTTFQTSASRTGGEAAVPRPTVSVIIPHYNDLENLDLCLSRLAEQNYPHDLVEIVVADNNSRCGFEAVEAVVRDRGRTVLATEQGAGPARNAAVESASGEILAFIDSDCVPDPRWIENGVRALDSTDIVGGRVDVLPRVPGELTAVEAFETVFAFDMKTYVTKKSFAGSGNLFVRKASFIRIGGFRKTVSEDMEWSHRAVGLGFRLTYGDDVAVGHPARTDWEQLAGKWRRLTHEAFAYHRLKGRSTLRWIMTSLIVLASPLMHSTKVLLTPKLSRIQDRARALIVLFMIRTYRFALMLSQIGPERCQLLKSGGKAEN